MCSTVNEVALSFTFVNSQQVKTCLMSQFCHLELTNLHMLTINYFAQSVIASLCCYFENEKDNGNHLFDTCSKFIANKYLIENTFKFLTEELNYISHIRIKNETVK